MTQHHSSRYIETKAECQEAAAASAHLGLNVGGGGGSPTAPSSNDAAGMPYGCYYKSAVDFPDLDNAARPVTSMAHSSTSVFLFVLVNSRKFMGCTVPLRRKSAHP